MDALRHGDRYRHFWLPYWVTGIALGGALALNAWTRNELWFWYTTIGLAVLLFAAGLVRTYHLTIPRAAVWTVGLTAAMHYGGGSLGGLHAIGGPNGLYYVFPWWDNVVHFLGSAALGVAAFTIVSMRLPQASAAVAGFLGVAVASLLGILIELYEFAQFVWFGTIDQGFYTNTMLDLYYNTLGAVVGTAAYAGTTVKRTRPRLQDQRRPTRPTRSTASPSRRTRGSSPSTRRGG